MEELLQQFDKLRVNVKDIGFITAKEIGVKEGEPPTNAFAMIHNGLRLGQELINAYYWIWKQTTKINSPTIDHARKENGERIIMIENMVFIHIMSSVEFCLKQYVVDNPQKIGRLKDKAHLIEIVKRSKSEGVLTESEFLRWEGVIKLRNVIVHNNGISDIKATYEYPKCKLEFLENKMIQCNLKLYPHLIDWLTHLYCSWIIKVSGN